MELSAYQMIQDIRNNLDESTATHWQDEEILKKLNQVQRRLAMKLSMTSGDWLVTSSDLTPSNSKITLPSDCAKPIYLEEASSGYEIPILHTLRERRMTRVPSLQLGDQVPDAYLLGNYIEINQDSYTETVTLWYEQRVADLLAGTANAGGATSLTVPSALNPVLVDDYYNGVTLEAESGTGAGTRTTVSDYVASTGVLTTAAGTFGADTVFGTYTELPQEAVPLLLIEATIFLMAKPSTNIDTKYFEMFRAMHREVKDDFRDWIDSRLKNSRYIRKTEYEV